MNVAKALPGRRKYQPDEHRRALTKVGSHLWHWVGQHGCTDRKHAPILTALPLEAYKSLEHPEHPKDQVKETARDDVPKDSTRQ